MAEITVIVPVLNDPDGIEKLLDSLRQQSLGDERFETLIVDNDSPQPARSRTRSLVERDSNVRLLQETRLQNSYAARNTGVRGADSPLIAFTDADCRPENTWLEEGMRAFEGDETLALAAGPVRFTFRDETPNMWELTDASFYLDQQKYVEQKGWGATANLFVRRRCFEEHGLFSENMRSGGDCEFGERVTGAGEKIAYLPDAVVNHRARSSLIELARKEQRVSEGYHQMVRRGMRPSRNWGLRDLFPNFDLPKTDYVNQDRVRKVKAIIGVNILYWLRIWYRW